MDAPTELQKMYDAGITFSISIFWSGGFAIKLGKYLNDFHTKAVCKTFEEAVFWLKEQVKFRYPDRDYGKCLFIT